MATGAVLFLPGCHELAAVYVVVTFEALLRGVRKIGGRFSAYCGSRWGRDSGLVTIDAACPLMRAFERKFRGGVVEGAKLFPIPRVVTGFACQLGGVRIDMAHTAALIGEMILKGNMWRSRFVLSWIGINRG